MYTFNSPISCGQENANSGDVDLVPLRKKPLGPKILLLKGRSSFSLWFTFCHGLGWSLNAPFSSVKVDFRFTASLILSIEAAGTLPVA